MTNPTELSDKLAQALGVSRDRVREAMLATVRDTLPANLPPDPMSQIAKQLGLSTEQVCAAFFDSSLGQGVALGGVVTHQVGQPPSKSESRVLVPAGKNVIELSTATPEQLSGPAQRLGVTPERLAAAVHAAAASMPLPPPIPPNADEIIRQFAQNLGLSEDRVRAAITQVEGNGRFYFAVPLPGFGR